MKPRLEVTVASDRMAARVKRGRRTVWCGECELPERDLLPDALASLQRQEGFPKQCAEVSFCLEPPLVQLRTLRDLPPVRAGELRRVVEQQANRFFRRRNSTLIVDARWEDRKNGSAHAGAVDVELVDVLRRAAVESNVRLVAILAVANSNENSKPLRFGGSDRRNRRIVRIGLGTILVSAWICGSYIAGYILDLEIDRRRLVREIEALRPELEVLDTARREIAEVVSVVGAIEAREQRRGWVSALLAGLTEGLPTTAHIVGVSGTPGAVTMELRATDVDSAVDSMITVGLPVVVEGDEQAAAIDAEADEWQTATIRLHGGARAGS